MTSSHYFSLTDPVTSCKISNFHHPSPLLHQALRKMAKRVVLVQQEEVPLEDRRRRQETVTVSILLEEESGEDQDKEDDVGAVDEREI